MTEVHIEYIQTALGDLVRSVPSWWKRSVTKAEATANLIERGLTDLNRLADAAEKLATMEISAIGDLVHVGVTAATPLPDAAPSPPPAGWHERNAITDFVAWLTTRPTAAKIGAQYEVPAALALIDEYAKLKGWGP